MDDAAEFLGGLLAVVAIYFGLAAFSAWSWMITVGAIHHEWLTNMPTVSYGGAFMIFMAFWGFAWPVVLLAKAVSD